MKYDRSGARPYAFLMISIATSCPFFTDSLPKFASASSMAKLPSKPAADLWPPSVPTVTKPCFSRVVHARRLQREAAETSHERAVVAPPPPICSTRRFHAFGRLTSNSRFGDVGFFGLTMPVTLQKSPFGLSLRS